MKDEGKRLEAKALRLLPEALISMSVASCLQPSTSYISPVSSIFIYKEQYYYKK